MKTRKYESTMVKSRNYIAFSSSYFRVFTIVLSLFRTFASSSSYFRVFVIVPSHLHHRTFASSSSYFRSSYFRPSTYARVGSNPTKSKMFLFLFVLLILLNELNCYKINNFSCAKRYFSIFFFFFILSMVSWTF